MQKNKDKIALDKWQKMQEKGKNKFIFRTGFLIYGMTLFLMYIFVVIIMNMVYHPEVKLLDFLGSSQFLKRLLSTFVLFGVMGWFMGNSIWRSYKRRWEEFVNKDGE